MSTETVRFLDIGGGPDSSSASSDSVVENTMNNLRSTKLALENPSRQHFVLDPNLSKSIARNLQKRVPNLRFIKGQVHPNRSLPFADEVFDIVEMNFLYTALTAPHLYGSQCDFQYEQRVGKNLVRPEDAPFLSKAVEESGRILKPGGRLFLCEQKQRMLQIMRLLSRDDNLELDSDFLREVCKLEAVDISEISDPERSRYTRSALFTHNLYVKDGITDKAEETKIILLELAKN